MSIGGYRRRFCLGRKLVNRPRRALAAGIVLVVGAAVAVAAMTATAQASPITPVSPDTARALAAQKATELVASRPTYLMASPDDAFAQASITSTRTAQFVAYERTYRGIPVVGGDFVLVL